MKVRRAQIDARHEAIISTTARRVCERDFDAVVLSDVMREAGMTHEAVCGHFPSNERLAVSAVAAASTDIVAYCDRRWRPRTKRPLSAWRPRRRGLSP